MVVEQSPSVSTSGAHEPNFHDFTPDREINSIHRQHDLIQRETMIYRKSVQLCKGGAECLPAYCTLGAHINTGFHFFFLKVTSVKRRDLNDVFQDTFVKEGIGSSEYQMVRWQYSLRPKVVSLSWHRKDRLYFDRATVRFETLTSLDLTSGPNRFLPLSLRHPLPLSPALAFLGFYWAVLLAPHLAGLCVVVDYIQQIRCRSIIAIAYRHYKASC